MTTTLLALAFSFQLQQDATDDAWRRMLASKKQIHEYLVARARKVTDDAAKEIADPATWESVRAKRLEQTRDMLGLLPWPARTPLNVRVHKRTDKGSYTIENISFESRPKVYVSANLYLPKTPAGPRPAVIYVCGHSYSPYGDKVQYQRHGISLAKNGYVAFVLDSIQIAETFALHHGVGWQEMPDWYSRGYTPAGVEVWNAIRAIDYLEARPDVDRNRIGMTGRSGGAAMTIFTAAVDPRIKVAAPVMGIATYASHVAFGTQRHHCDCMFPINSWAHDMLHLAALISPRPLLVAHGRKDTLFPVPGYEEIEQRITPMYAKNPQAFRNIVVETGHEDSNFLREQAIRWFDEHLMGVRDRKLDMDYSNAPVEQLAVFGAGGAPPADAANYRVHETFIPAAAAKSYTSLAAWQTHSKDVIANLRTRVFASINRPSELKVLSTVKARGGFDDIQLETEPGITVRVMLKRPADAAKTNVPVLVHIASDGEDPESIDGTWRGVNMRGNAIRLIVYPRGIGEVGWDRSFERDTLRAAMQVGETTDSMRLYDVLKAVEFVRSREPQADPARVMLMGRGVSAGLAIYAALLDERIAQVMLLDPPVSHANGNAPVFLNVLRHTDLPEAAALLYPRRVNFYARMPKEYEYTKRIFELGGKGDHVFLAMQIEGVLEGRYAHDYSSGH
jgi:dienelactone hydrolase